MQSADVYNFTVVLNQFYGALGSKIAMTPATAAKEPAPNR